MLFNPALLSCPQIIDVFKGLNRKDIDGKLNLQMTFLNECNLTSNMSELSFRPFELP